MRIFFTALIFTVASSGAFAQNFAIGHRTITYNDPARSNRAIATEIYYPATTVGDNAQMANGQFPVVVFGHGFSMAYSAYQNWWEEFVPDGFIFMFPKTEGGLLPAPSHSAFGLDLAFLAAQMQTDNGVVASPFYGKVLPRTALMGHSMGGGASVLGASSNSSIQCIVGLAPAETNPSAVTAAPNVSVPALILYGTEDQVTPEATHSLAIFNQLGSECKVYTRLDQGAHCFYANYNFFCATGEMNIGTLTREQQQALSYTIVRPWLRYFLMDDCAAYTIFEGEITTNPGLGTNIISCSNEAPVIVDNNGTLSSTVASNYQWYLDGQPLAGEVQQQHVYSLSGTYQVGAVNIGQCELLSNGILISPTGISNEINSFAVRVGDGHVNIELISPEQNIEITWFDVSGRILASMNLFDKTSGSQIKSEIPVHLGLKFLVIRTSDSQQVVKVF